MFEYEITMTGYGGLAITKTITKIFYTSDDCLKWVMEQDEDFDKIEYKGEK